MIVLKATQDKVLAVLQSVSGIVERRHTLPILASVLVRRGGTSISNGFPESGGGGASSRDIPDGSDNDLVARRLHRAAERETDPELKEKLWKEYADYKRNT